MFVPANFEHFKKINALLMDAKIDDSAYTTVNILGWQHYFSPKIWQDEHFVLLTFEVGDKVFFQSPLAKDADSYNAALDLIESLGGTAVQLAQDWQLPLLEARGFRLKNKRSMAEYLYDPVALSTLKGKKYHAKRNFINGFSHDYVYRAYTPSDFDGVMQLMENWNLASHAEGDNTPPPATSWSYIQKELKMSDFDMERDVLARVLQEQEAFGVLADVLEIGGVIVGFCAGQLLPNSTGVLFFEKGNFDYKGIYPLIDNLFIQTHFAGARIINKQEDLGLAGLRKSKLSYHPIRLLERYEAAKCALREAKP